MSNEVMTAIEVDVFYCTNPAHGDDCRLVCTAEDSMHIPDQPIPVGEYALVLTYATPQNGEGDHA